MDQCEIVFKVIPLTVAFLEPCLEAFKVQAHRFNHPSVKSNVNVKSSLKSHKKQKQEKVIWRFNTNNYQRRIICHVGLLDWSCQILYLTLKNQQVPQRGTFQNSDFFGLHAVSSPL